MPRNIRHPSFMQRLALVLLWTLLAASLIYQPLAMASKGTQQPISKYRNVNKKLESTNDALQLKIKAENVTLRSLEQTNRQLMKVTKEHKTSQKKLKTTTRKLNDLKSEVAALKAKVVKNREWFSLKLRAMNRYGKYGDALLLLGNSSDLSQFIRRWKYMERLAGNQQQAIKNLKASIRQLKIKAAQLDKVLIIHKAQEHKVAETARRLAAEKMRKEKMLQAVRNDKKSYQRIQRELRKEAARMKKIISQSERVKRKTYSGRGFRKYKGRLHWPARGKVAVPYGKHNDPNSNIPVFRNGIYISLPDDTVAKAVGKGKVVFADWFEGYGQLVIINHGEGYHTLYANLSEIFLSTGDIIKVDERVGRVGTSGVINKPALYFEIRYKGKPLNPSAWLSK